MKTCMITGSFDPFTNGHLDLVNRVRGVFDRVYVALLVNPLKQYLFTVEQRLQIAKTALADYDNVRVISYAGMTYALAKELQVDYLVRGLRTESDFTYELEMAEFNMQEGGIDTICLMTNGLQYVSSTDVRMRLESGEDLQGLVPDKCLALVRELYLHNII